VADDPDPATAAAARALLARAAGQGPSAAAALAELADSFCGLLEFGTAGLRGRLGAGPNRMNRAVVIRAAAALAAYLRDVLAGRDTNGPRVVIGFDARHGSAQLALDTAAVLTAAGGTTMLLPGPLPTPVLAFAVRHLSADAGVMVTASHNPAGDNGYKVYLGGRVETGSGQGAQLVPPADTEIAARMRAVASVRDVPRAEEGWHVLDGALREAYLTRVASRGGTSPAPPGRGRPRPGAPRIVLTPLHGVGGPTAVEALARSGFVDVHVVPEQAVPDPDFPTTPLPNPEEPGALDLAIRTADGVGAGLVLALDPDADRCAVAIPRPDGGWQVLTGDEVGALLGQVAVDAAPAGGVVASSVVSSRLLSRIAAAGAVPHVTTLTGFKWIARVPGLVFGYEEALGYCVDPAAVRDKDGIAAAVRIAELAADLATHGGSLTGALDDLAREHGLYATAQLSVRVADRIAPAMDRLRAAPPAALAGSPVRTAQDLAAGAAGLPPTDALVYGTAADDRVVVRPSGTEPKLKCYLETVVPVTDGDVAAARALAAARLASLRADVAALVGAEPARPHGDE
jgi:phosphomannomutase